MRPISKISHAPVAVTAATNSSLLAPAASASSAWGGMQPRSPWHSPVPYLFGGLAAMLGLIAFALLILACSYWRLSGHLDINNGEGGDEGDLESGNEKDGSSDKRGKVYEEKILVIMAGNEKPTYLATPVSSRASSFGDKSAKIENKEGKNKVENCDKMKEEVGSNPDQIRTTTTTTAAATAAATEDQGQEEEGHNSTRERQEAEQV